MREEGGKEGGRQTCKTCFGKGVSKARPPDEIGHHEKGNHMGTDGRGGIRYCWSFGKAMKATCRNTVQFLKN